MRAHSLYTSLLCFAFQVIVIYLDDLRVLKGREDDDEDDEGEGEGRNSI